MNFAISVAIVSVIAGVVMQYTEIHILREIIANQEQQLALCQAPKLPAMNCQHYMDNLAADQSVTYFCIRMTYRDKEK